jgi:hypothetical protein
LLINTYQSVNDSLRGGYSGIGATDGTLTSVIGASYSENLLTLTSTGGLYSSAYMVGVGGCGAPALFNSGSFDTFGGNSGTYGNVLGYFVGQYYGYSSSYINGNANMAVGGGGGVYSGGTGYAGNGGSGVVIISMPTTTYNMLSSTTNVNSTTVNGSNTILRWKTTGTFRIS